MRFRREQHLRRQGDFKAVREQGRRIDCGAYTVWYRVRADSGEIPAANAAAESAAPGPRFAPTPPDLVRIGFVASTAQVGQAVERNRARRRLRAIVRENQRLVPAGTDLLLVARAAVNRWDHRELTEKFIGACRRLQPAKDA
jgi:ribonuclease P protein component